MVKVACLQARLACLCRVKQGWGTVAHGVAPTSCSAVGAAAAAAQSSAAGAAAARPLQAAQASGLGNSLMSMSLSEGDCDAAPAHGHAHAELPAFRASSHRMVLRMHLLGAQMPRQTRCTQ